jgi:hypothetical protein
MTPDRDGCGAADINVARTLVRGRAAAVAAGNFPEKSQRDGDEAGMRRRDRRRTPR